MVKTRPINSLVRLASGLRRTLDVAAPRFSSQHHGAPRFPLSASIANSDKHYWHRYTETYQSAFAALADVRRVIEFGVFHGASIRWLAECFPHADIIGADILAPQQDWPTGPAISYRRVDQADRIAVRTMLNAIQGEVDLIIDDGSHIPRHQATCLIEGMTRIRPKGLYILEDICTSHPLQPEFAHYSLVDGERIPNALNVLMAIQHIVDTGIACVPEKIYTLSAPGFFSRRDIEELFAMTGQIEIYKRTRLPLRCYACGGSDFNYVTWRCRCGTELYHPANSMTALVWKR
jgi:hypothetical protein